MIIIKKLLLVILGTLAIAVFSLVLAGKSASYATYKVDECQGECIAVELQCPQGYEETKSKQGDCRQKYWSWNPRDFGWKWRYTDKIEVCTEYENLCVEPEPTPEPEVTPSVPYVPQPQPPNPALPPVCVDKTPLELPKNVHVERNGAEATVNFFTKSSNANIYYRTSGTEGWEHALRDVPVTNGYVSVTIHDLKATGDYDFGVESSNGCAGSGEKVLAVVVDDWQPRIFGLTHYEWLK